MKEKISPIHCAKKENKQPGTGKRTGHPPKQQKGNPSSPEEKLATEVSAGWPLGKTGSVIGPQKTTSTSPNGPKTGKEKTKEN